MLKEIVTYVVHHLVDKPEEVSITEILSDSTYVLKLRVNPEDRGKIIGKEGKMARAIRTILHIAAINQGKRAILEIVD